MQNTMSPAQLEFPWMLNRQPEMIADTLTETPQVEDEDMSQMKRTSPTLPSPFLRLFFHGHLCMLKKSTPANLLCKEYLILISTCMKELEHYEQSEEILTLKSDTLQAYLVWSFIDIVHLTDLNNRNFHISHYLSLWFCQTYPDVIIYPNDTDNSNAIEEDKETWSEIVKTVLIGELVECKNMLSEIIRRKGLDGDEWREVISAIHLGMPEKIPKGVSSFIILESLLESCPDRKDERHFMLWQQNIKQWLDMEINDNQMMWNEHTRRILKIITGDMTEIEIACSTWQQMLLACCIYCCTNIEQQHGRDNDMNILRIASGMACGYFDAPCDVAGGALVNVTLGNYKECIECLHEIMPSQFFCIHLLDILVSTQKMNKDDVVQLQEDYTVEYVESLMDNKKYGMKCWRIAIDYCPSSKKGVELMIEMLYKTSINNDLDYKTIEKILNVCKKKHLQVTCNKICEHIGDKCIRNGHYGKGLLWYIKSDCKDKCEKVGKLAVRKAEKGGPLSAGSRKLEGVSCIIRICDNVEIKRELLYVVMYNVMQEGRIKLQIARQNRNNGTRMMMKSNSDDSENDSGNDSGQGNSNGNDGGDEEEEDDEEIDGKSFVESVKLLLDGNNRSNYSADREFWGVIVYESCKVIELYGDIGMKFGRKGIFELICGLELICNNEQLLSGLKHGIGRGDDYLQSRMDHCRTVLLQSVGRTVMSPL